MLFTVINASDSEVWIAPQPERETGPDALTSPAPSREAKEEQMVHLVTAVIKPFKLEEVKDALRGIGI
ncbi:MAG: hypothetical protein ACXV8G_12550, partial [Acidimicrobiales bacterium]